jgi:hypothetical protein
MVLNRPTAGVASRIASSERSKGSPMSEPSSSATGKAGAPKQPVSPLRNIIGLIVLAVVVVFGWLEYSAKSGYNAAVKSLDERSKVEDKGLMTLAEAEAMMNKAADDAGSDVQDGNVTFTKKNYTWKGVINSYTVAAYYTKQKEPALHHYEAGEKFQAEPKTTERTHAGADTTPKEMPTPKAVSKTEKAQAEAKEKADHKQAEAKEKADDKKAEDKKPEDKEAKTPEKGN